MRNHIRIHFTAGRARRFGTLVLDVYSAVTVPTCSSHSVLLLQLWLCMSSAPASLQTTTSTLNVPHLSLSVWNVCLCVQECLCQLRLGCLFVICDHVCTAGSGCTSWKVKGCFLLQLTDSFSLNSNLFELSCSSTENEYSATLKTISLLKERVFQFGSSKK